MRASAKSTNRGRKQAPTTLAARIVSHVDLEISADGKIVASFDGPAVAMGRYGAGTADSARKLRTGLPLGTGGGDGWDADTQLLVRRLAAHGFLEYRLGNVDDGADAVVIEPQAQDYWPGTPRLHDNYVLALSRFAYMHRRGDEIVLESPRARALFKLCDPRIAAALLSLSAPLGLKHFRRQEGFPGIELLSLLVDCDIVTKVDPVRDSSNRPTNRLAEGDDSLALWDFHDLVFHTRSTAGRHANPLGGLYPYAAVMPPLPAVRPRWPGTSIDLHQFSDAGPQALSPAAALLQARHSTRVFDERRPITLAELATLLDRTHRVRARWTGEIEPGGGGPVVEYAGRPYPSGGGCYELELYLAVARCEGLENGFYHYDADGHALVPIAVRNQDLQTLLTGAEYAMGAPAVPQILITIAARFGRVSWKYSSLAYSLVLKDVGVLTQTLYLTATDLGLGGCAIGNANIDLFAKLTGIDIHVEGPVGLFALGRGAETEASG